MIKNSESECLRVLTYLYEYAGSTSDALDDEVYSQYEQHIANCAVCLSRLQADSVISRLLRSCCVAEAPDHLRMRITQRTVLSWKTGE